MRASTYSHPGLYLLSQITVQARRVIANRFFTMLPAEAFAEVVAFFALYDLDALKLTNRLCYQLAQQCANRIRVFDFSHLTFDIKTSNGNFKIYVVGRLIDEDVGRPHRLASSIRFADENEMSTFVAQAFRNCTLRQLTLNNRHFDRNAIVAMKEIANTMIISKTLSILIESNDTLSETFEFVDAFRHVEVRLLFDAL